MTSKGKQFLCLFATLLVNLKNIVIRILIFLDLFKYFRSKAYQKLYLTKLEWIKIEIKLYWS